LKSADGNGKASIDQLDTNKKKMETAISQCMMTAVLLKPCLGMLYFALLLFLNVNVLIAQRHLEGVLGRTFTT
jgi:hypothetical protein